LRNNSLRVLCALSSALFTAQVAIEAQTLPEPPQSEAKRILTQDEKEPPFLCEPSLQSAQGQDEVQVDVNFLEPFAPLEGELGPFEAHLFSVAGVEHEKRNYEILAIAADRASLAYVSGWPAPSQFLVNKTAALSLSNALTLGNLEEADKFWKVVKETLDFNAVPASQIYELYPKLAKQLVWAGRQADAELLAKKLLARFDGKQTDYIDSYHYTNYTYREPVLKVCAQVLAARTPEANAALTLLPQFKLLNSINEAIEKGPVDQSPLAISQLLDLYKQSPMVTTAERPALNYYCALLNVARKLSDKKLYDQSDELLNKLQALAPAHEQPLGQNLFTTAELAINSERRGNGSAFTWSKAKARVATFDQYYSNCFRYLSLAYAAAGQYDRAQTILKHAEQLSDSEHAVHKNLTGRILLLLDKANLAAAQDQTKQSETYFNTALEQFAALNGADAGEYRAAFDSKVMTKIVTVIRTNIQKKRLAQAERDLGRVMALKWTAPPRSNYSGPNEAQTYNLLPLKVELAKLYFARGEFQKAHALVNESDAWDNTFGELLLFKADCAAAVKDWPKALDGYMTAPFQGHSINPPSSIPGFTEFSLKKALAVLPQITSPDKTKVSSLYQAIALVYEMAPYDPEQALKFYTMAYDLCPDSSSEKSKLAAKIAETDKSNAFFKIEEKTKQGIAVEDTNINTAQVLKKLIESAQFGEKNSSDDRDILWFNVALAEVEAGHFDSAIAHTQHGLDLIYRPLYMDGTPRILEQAGAMKSIAVADKGRPVEAEKLFVTALQKFRQLYGANSIAAQLLESEFFNLYKQTKKEDQALAVLDHILEKNQHKLQYKRSSEDIGTSSILPWNLKETTDEKERVFYLKVLNKYLSAYKRYCPADDMHIGLTLRQIANLEQSTDSNKAIADYNAALVIAKIYGDQIAIQGVSAELEKLLRKHDRNVEAAKTVSECRTFTNRIEALNTPPQSKSLDEQTAKQEIHDEQTRRVEFMQKEIPYSEQTKAWLYQSICASEKNDDLAVINRLVPVALKAFNHSPEAPSNSDLNGWSNIHTRCRLYKLIITSNIQHGDLDTGKKWLQTALKEKLDIPSIEELIFLAEMELECGNRNAAKVFCQEAQSEYKANSYNHIFGDSLSVICKKLGIESERQ